MWKCGLLAESRIHRGPHDIARPRATARAPRPPPSNASVLPAPASTLFIRAYINIRNFYHTLRPLKCKVLQLTPFPTLSRFPPPFRLSLPSAAVHVEPSPQVSASGRLAFGRFTVSREGLTVLLWLAELTALLPPPGASKPLPRTSLASPQTPQNQERRELQEIVGSPSTVNQKKVPAGGWARKSSPRPHSSPRLHRVTSSSSAPATAVAAVPPPRVPARPPSVLPTEGLPWCRKTDGFRRRFSYVVVFEVDLAGIVVAGDGDGGGDVSGSDIGSGGGGGGGGGDVQHGRPTRSASGGGKAGGLSVVARGPGISDDNSNRNRSMNGVGGGGIGVGGRRDFSASAAGVSRTDSLPPDIAGTDDDLQGGGATLIRLTVPRVAIRVCSPSSVVLPSGRGAVFGARTREGGSAPTVIVTAKWLEGHLEMEDPGTRVVPPLPTPSQTQSQTQSQSQSQSPPPPPVIPVESSPTASTLGNVETVDGGAGVSPPLSALSDNASSASGLPEIGAGCCEETQSSSACAPAPTPTPVPPAAVVGVPTVTAEGVSGSGKSEDGAVGLSEMGNDASRPSPPPPPLLGAPRGETHRLRWLAVRKLSFRMAEPPSFPVASSPDGSKGAGTGGGAASVGRTPGVEAAGVEEDGVSVEGLWAEWSPALFFLAGKSGAMVR